MTGKAQASLSRLFTSAKSLNEVSDKINAQIKDIESALVVQGIGVSAWIDLETWSEESSGQTVKISTTLGYGKYNGRWALLYDVWCDQMDESQTSFLCDASRDTRIKALEKLPDLLDKLAEETQKLTQQATQSLTVAQEIVSALKTNGRK